MFTREDNSLFIRIVARTEEPVSGAEIVQTVTLPAHSKLIEIDNQLYHVKDLINTHRYYRFGYYAFPFAVENARHQVQLDGCVAEHPRDQTGHGTDTYMGAREWSAVENDKFGVAVLQLDSHLVEFGCIHPDKTDFGGDTEGSAIYSALFNDWLQMHTPGGSHVNPRFRYAIVSYAGDYRSAKIPALAENFANPLLALPVSAHPGTLPAKHSFIQVQNANLRLLTLKRAENGDGIIARFHETCGQTALREITQSLAEPQNLHDCTVDELPLPIAAKEILPYDYWTVRLTGNNLSTCEPLLNPPSDGRPAAIGSVYTGLITAPRAACGAPDGQLYLIWGQNQENDLSHYELYRSEAPGFTPEKNNFLAKVEPGKYRVALYEDTGLKHHATYYYRVRAVNKAGLCGEFSEEFAGTARE